MRAFVRRLRRSVLFAGLKGEGIAVGLAARTALVPGADEIGGGIEHGGFDHRVIHEIAPDEVVLVADSSGRDRIAQQERARVLQAAQGNDVKPRR
jgi:hypothetical protein